jgi:thiol:disulfide interchange protein DsbG
MSSLSPMHRPSMWSLVLTFGRVLGLAVLAFFVVRGVVAVVQQLRGVEAAVPEATAVAPVLPAPILAQTPAERLSRARALLAGIPTQSSASVRQVFASTTGMTGLIVDTPQGPLVAWMPDTHEVLIVGAVFDRSGRNITQEQMLERGFATAADAPHSARGRADTDERLFATLQAAPGVTEGRGGPLVIAFIDPKCAYCNQLWRLTRQPIAEARLRVRWLPVAVLGDDSSRIAAAVLQSPQPLAVLAQHELGAQPLLPVAATEATREALLANEALLRLLAAGRTVTPVLVARGAQGPLVSPGVPPDLGAWLKEAR